VAERRGDRARSVALIDEALRLAEEIGSRPDTSDLLRLRADGGVRAALSRAGASGGRHTVALDEVGVAEQRNGLPDLHGAGRRLDHIPRMVYH
jgi:hypothetical protein